jgi:Mrp family chromosome partitioning ATPase
MKKEINEAEDAKINSSSQSCSQKCDHDCDSCEEKSEEGKNDFRIHLDEMSHIKKTIAIISGKGGVGKSMVTSMLAVTMQRFGHKTAILDADLTGPSIPKMFGVREKIQQSDFGLLPAISKTGIKIMSINLLIENDTVRCMARPPDCENRSAILDRCGLG